MISNQTQVHILVVHGIDIGLGAYRRMRWSKQELRRFCVGISNQVCHRPLENPLLKASIQGEA